MVIFLHLLKFFLYIIGKQTYETSKEFMGLEIKK